MGRVNVTQKIDIEARDSRKQVFEKLLTRSAQAHIHTAAIIGVPSSLHESFLD